MPKLLATDGEGERLDRFELIAEIASGGMATVYLARLSGVAGFQRLVAIKRLHPHLAKEPEFVEMFLDEARLAARIHHPNVVPIQEVGESESGYYLVMDYVEGNTLARLLTRAAQIQLQIPWAVTIRIVLDTLAGLHAAHELTDDLGQPLFIVHRDVSPQNILVGLDGITRITDFGVARAASRLTTTRSGQLKGKLAYMAPEQARGADIDRRADLFSCGIVLWEALALKRLFRGEGEASTLNRVLNEPIPAPSSQRPGIPRELEAVCMRALERDVDKRYPTAEAFAEDLERCAQRVASVGTVRDVAMCLEQAFGADLSQQREAVRAWLARSEPSGVGPRSSKRVVDSVPTLVEGSRPEGPRVVRTTGEPVDRLAVTVPSPLTPEHVSSLGSAVVHLAGADAGRARWSAARLLPATAAALLVIGVAAWGANRLAGGPAGPASAVEPPSPSPSLLVPEPTPSAVEPPAPAPPAAAAAAEAVETEVAPAEPTPTAEAPAVAAPSRTTPGRSAPARGTGRKPSPSPKASSSAAAPSSVTEDLWNNPYR